MTLSTPSNLFTPLSSSTPQDTLILMDYILTDIIFMSGYKKQSPNVLEEQSQDRLFHLPAVAALPLIPTCAPARLSPCLSFLVEVSDTTKRSVRLNCVTMVASSALTQGGDPSANNASLGQELSGPKVGFLSGVLLIRKAGTNGK